MRRPIRFVVAILLCHLTACDRAQDIAPAALVKADGAFTEAHDDDVEVTWLVDDDGLLRATVVEKDQVVEEVTGTVTVRPLGKRGDSKEVELEVDDGLLHAKLGGLDADVTEIEYRLVVGKRTLTGTLHVPDGGTKELVAEADDVGDDEGPHGGVVQKVGDDLIEVVGDEREGKVRVYVLDDDHEPKEIDTDREITLVLGHGKGDVVVMKPHGDEGFYVAEIHDEPPARITVVVKLHGTTHVALCGHRRGHVFVVGRHGPTVKIFARGWHHVHGIPPGHRKWKVKGGPHKIHVKAKGKGGRGGKVKVKIH